MQVSGMHHVTAISGEAQRNLEFYTRGLGLRFVKRTVNFDDPGTYHLYYGDALGRPGTVMTFFPWPHLPPARPGVGEVARTSFAVPPGSLAFWRRRLAALGVAVSEDAAFGEARLLFRDPDGLALALVESGGHPGASWTTGEIGEDVAIRGLHGVTLRLAERQGTEAVLALLGYAPAGHDGALFRHRRDAPAGIVDIALDPDAPAAVRGTGSVHHVAFAVPDQAAQLALRQRLVAAGQRVTPPIDRRYFISIYFQTPGGVLFEIATAGPGFAVDEDVEELGRSLQLPPQHEHLRAELERSLPPLHL